MSGRDIFSYFCISCHGRNGRGDGPVAAALKVKPANLTRLSAANGGRFPAERVRAFVAHGRPDIPAHGSPEMPIWGPIFQGTRPVRHDRAGPNRQRRRLRPVDSGKVAGLPLDDRDVYDTVGPNTRPSPMAIVIASAHPSPHTASARPVLS